MKTLSVPVPESDYEALRRAAAAKNRSFDDLVREAIALYRAERLKDREPLTDLPVLAGHRLIRELPSRTEVWEEILHSDEIRQS
jgi:hypothetical protein